ncbi:MAG: AmmeMemoRadiSam system protein A [Actinobacteria bacterium]|nr:AmmeMemoRadiSam system protein A [Actinomycetota bacterium]
MENIELTLEHKKTLIKIARESITSAVNGNMVPEYKIDDAILNTMCGAFVTLHTDGNLRGCIGNTTAKIPLWETIRNMAMESALRDPRFPSVSPRELENIDIEISVLSPLKRINNLEEIEVGKHGLFIKKGFYQGLLLPQVATDYKWNRIQFLEQTCYKAGLSKNCYKQETTEIFIFSAIVFGEKDLEKHRLDK